MTREIDDDVDLRPVVPPMSNGRRHFGEEECKAMSFTVDFRGKILQCEPGKTTIEAGQPLPIEVLLPHLTPMIGGWTLVPNTNALAQEPRQNKEAILVHISMLMDQQINALREQYDDVTKFLRNRD